MSRSRFVTTRDHLVRRAEAAYYIRLVLLTPRIGYTYATFVNRS